jgi:hypothetical protein
MRKGLRILMALFALVLIPDIAWAQIDYDLWIGDYRVNSNHLDDIHSENDSIDVGTDGYVKFDPVNNVLTLKDATLKHAIRSDILDLTIQFVGTNEVNTEALNTNLYSFDIGYARPNAIQSGNLSASLTFEKIGTGMLELYGRQSKSPVYGFANVIYGSGCFLLSAQPTTGYAGDCYKTFYTSNLEVDAVTITTTKTYPIWIRAIMGGRTSIEMFQQVTEDNIDNITAPSITSGTMSYNPNSNILTLNNATITSGKILSAIGDLKIDNIGQNIIESGDSGSCIRSANTGELTIAKGSEDAFLKLETAENLSDPNHPVIQGFGTLSYTDFVINSTTASAPTYAVFNDGNNDVMGLYDANQSTPASRGVLDASFEIDYGLTVKGKAVTSLNATNVFEETTPTVSFTPASSTNTTNTLTLDNFKVTNDVATIVSSLDNLTIVFKGENELGSNSGYEGYIKSTNANAPLTFMSDGTSTGTLVLHGGNSDAVVEGFASVSYDNVYWNYSEPITYDTTDKRYENRSEYILQNLTITTTVYYPLWLTDTQVSSKNEANILDDNTASFDPTHNILTLDGCTISSLNGIMSGLDDLTISLKGDNSIFTEHDNYSPIYSSVGTATLTIQKADGVNYCSLYLGTYATDPVIKGFSSVTHDGLDFEATSGSGTTLADDDTYAARLSFTTYPLSIAGTPVTNLNAADVFNDQKVSFVLSAADNSGTLTLKGAAITGLVEWSGDGNFFIELDGENSITNSAEGADALSYNPATPTTNATLTVQLANGATNGTLTLASNSARNPISGFDTPYNTTLYLLPETDDGTQKTCVFTTTILGGDGTSANPYHISSPADLKDFSTYVNLGILDTDGKIITLDDNIDCANLTGFEPIGNTNYPFKGTFNGTDKTISNLTASGTDAGLFGRVDGGSISHLILDNCTFTGTSNAGAIAGYVGNTGSISYTKVKGTSSITSNTSAGAIAGANNGALTANYYEYTVTTTVTGGTTQTGFDARGVGNPSGDETTDDGAVLYTKKMLKASITNGTLSSWYPSSNVYTDNDKFAPGQTAYIKVTPNSGYAVSSVSVTYTGNSTQETINPVLDGTNSTDTYSIYSFTMPDANDVTANASFLIDISSTSYTATIDDATYTTTAASLVPTTVILDKTDKTATFTLTNGTDFTITGYTKGGTAVTAPETAGDYLVTIQGMGNYTGTKANIAYTIKKASSTITTNPAAIANLIYSGDNQNLITAGVVTGGTMKYSLDVNAADEAWTTTVPTGKDAKDYDVYYMVVENENYTGIGKSADVKVSITIAQASLENAVIGDITNQIFTGLAIEPAITVTFNGQAVDASEYTVVYTNNTDVSGNTLAKVTITSTGKNFTTGSTQSKEFNIVAASVTITATDQTVTYNGTAQAYTNYSADNENAVLAVAYYTSEADRTAGGTGIGVPTNTGVYYVRVTQTNANYTAEAKDATFTIINRTATAAELGLSDNQTYATYYTETEDLELPNDVVAYIITDVSGTSVTTKRISYIPNGVAVLVKKGTSTEATTDVATGNQLQGTATGKTVSTITGGTVYVLYNGEFVKTTSGTVPANRCYLVVANGAGARKLTIVHDDDDSTGIRGIEFGESEVENWYDLQGHKIQKPTKAGLYIINGKKIVVK